MWQQPAPPASSTNPFAGPAGSSVRKHRLLSLSSFLCQLAVVCFRASCCFEFFVADAHLSSLFLSLALLPRRKRIQPFPFLSLSLSPFHSTNQLTVICMHSPTIVSRALSLSPCLLRLIIATNNTLPTRNVFLDEKKMSLSNDRRVARLYLGFIIRSTLHRSMCSTSDETLAYRRGEKKNQTGNNHPQNKTRTDVCCT